MLSLACATPERWLQQVDESLEDILIDHAHCEKKAASTAMSLISAYIDDENLCRAMTEIVNEELEHFHLVLDLLRQRGIAFRRLRPSSYGRKLIEIIRKQEPDRAVDRLLVASLIEARSCERFDLLRKHLQDEELSAFYGSLFESEARHHTTYVKLARRYAGNAEDVELRLSEIAAFEAQIINEGDPRPRMHS